jgi:glycosyltransferase involved in cell wall biosynthesis
MLISVCIPTVRSTTIVAAVASVLRQTWTDWELIVVGQGPETNLRSRVEGAAGGNQRVRYVHVKRPGLSRARNAGIDVSRGDVIAMTDDDCEADSRWLAEVAACFAEDPRIGLVGGALLPPARARGRLVSCPSLVPADVVYDPSAMGRHAPRGWDWIGGNFAVRREVAQRAGPFDEYLGAGALFPGGEDTDYKLRLESLGIRMRTTPRAIVHHTYGARHGIAAGLRHSRNYARGNGALAGKLTLLGDPRGEEWLQATARESRLDWLQAMKPYRLPVSALRLWHFRRAYRQCVREFRVDVAQGVLYPVEASHLQREGNARVGA